MESHQVSNSEEPTFRFCPKCGSSDISPNQNSNISNGNRSTSSIEGSAGIGGIRVGGQNLSTRERSISSDFTRDYVCIDCGYSFNNAGFLTIFNKIFAPNEVFVSSYKILTGEKDFQSLVAGLGKVKDKIINRLSNAELDKPMRFTFKIFGTKFIISARKFFDEEADRVWFILEQISKKEGN